MKRDSFLFYRSFYEAIKGLPRDIQLEVYTAIMEYAIYGNLSEDMKPFASSVFTLVKPVIDTNIKRYSNGKRGGRRKHPKAGGEPSAADTETTGPYNLSFTEEADKMKSEATWKESVCMRYSLSPEELDSRIDAFAVHCRCERGDEPHSGLTDAKRHFQSWMRKAYPPAEKQPDRSGSESSDYSFKGGFGGQDT